MLRFLLALSVHCLREAWRDDVPQNPVQGVVAPAVHKLFRRARSRSGIDRNHDRPLQSFRTMNGDDLDCLAFGVNDSFGMRGPLRPIGIEIASKLPETAYAISSRPLQNGIHIGKSARSLVGAPGDEDGAQLQPLYGFCNQERGRRALDPAAQIAQDREAPTLCLL